jgi:hypothetical protein
VLSHLKPRHLWICGLAMILGLVQALLIDEAVYWQWRGRMEGVASELRTTLYSANPVAWGNLSVRPSRYFLRPGKQFVMLFEPPAVVWTYHLAKTRVSFRLVSGWNWLKWKTVGAHFWQNNSAVEFAWPHTHYAIGVASCAMLPSPCKEPDVEEWYPFVGHGPVP